MIYMSSQLKTEPETWSNISISILLSLYTRSLINSPSPKRVKSTCDSTRHNRVASSSLTIYIFIFMGRWWWWMVVVVVVVVFTPNIQWKVILLYIIYNIRIYSGYKTERTTVISCRRLKYAPQKRNDQALDPWLSVVNFFRFTFGCCYWPQLMWEIMNINDCFCYCRRWWSWSCFQFHCLYRHHWWIKLTK